MRIVSQSWLPFIKRIRCTSCMNDSRHSSKSNGSSCEAVFSNNNNSRSQLGSPQPPSEPPLPFNTSSPGRSSVSHGTSEPQLSPLTPSISAGIATAHTSLIEPFVPLSSVQQSPEPLQVESGSDRAMTSPQAPIVRPLHRKQCIVICSWLPRANCSNSTMWRSHIIGSSRTGSFYGDVPKEWLQEQGLYICECLALVAKSRFASHSRRCLAGLAAPQTLIPLLPESSHSTSTVLPSFEEVCLLSCRTLRYIPKKSRPAFALALYFSLKAVLHDNSLHSSLAEVIYATKVPLAVKKTGW